MKQDGYQIVSEATLKRNRYEETIPARKFLSGHKQNVLITSKEDFSTQDNDIISLFQDNHNRIKKSFLIKVKKEIRNSYNSPEYKQDGISMWKEASTADLSWIHLDDTSKNIGSKIVRFLSSDKRNMRECAFSSKNRYFGCSLDIDKFEIDDYIE